MALFCWNIWNCENFMLFNNQNFNPHRVSKTSQHHLLKVAYTHGHYWKFYDMGFNLKVVLLDTLIIVAAVSRAHVSTFAGAVLSCSNILLCWYISGEADDTQDNITGSTIDYACQFANTMKWNCSHIVVYYLPYFQLLSSCS